MKGKRMYEWFGAKENAIMMDHSVKSVFPLN
jgi:hypothetical protein